MPHFPGGKKATDLNTCMYLARYFCRFNFSTPSVLRSGVIFGNSFPEKKSASYGAENTVTLGYSTKIYCSQRSKSAGEIRGDTECTCITSRNTQGHCANRYSGAFLPSCH